MNANGAPEGGAPRKRSEIAAKLLRPFKWLIGSLSHNIALKALSFLLAILLWNYVISTNTSITRTKVLTGVTGYVSGQSTLNSNDLALLEDPAGALSNITVTVDAPQTYYSRISGDNVQVTLDLSSVRTAGTRLRAALTRALSVMR